MSTIISILDGYTDEPSCLGVPPFLAPLPRYIYGAIKNASKDFAVNYMTIDEYRSGRIRTNIIVRDKLKRLANSKLLVIIAGTIVPGKYLRGTPISFRECLEIAQEFVGVRFIGGASVRFGFKTELKKRTWEKLKNVFDLISTQDLDAAVFDYLSIGKLQKQHRLRTASELKTWGNIGAQLVAQHPDTPASLVIELEAGRGCVRYFTGGCSFCSEPQFGKPVFRSPKDIADEVKHLSDFGGVNFRLGALSCIFSYMAKGLGDSETPKPNPKMVKKLLSGIRFAVPSIKVLHLDNANPAVMAAHIKETKQILKTIIENCTGGNILSFGLESADPAVIKANNLNTTPEDVQEMITLINQYGAKPSKTGLPELLPGLNYVYGLKGETKKTFKYNFEFLKSILDQGLLLRRINLRQVLPVTSFVIKEFNTKKRHKEFIKHKRMVREQIDRPMLQRMIPGGTVLKNVFTEKVVGNITFARQLGTYPILIGIPYKTRLNEFYDIVITDYGYRSLTGFTSPFNINSASMNALQALPKIGSKRAARLIKSRPYRTLKDIHKALDDPSILENIEEHLYLKLSKT